MKMQHLGDEDRGTDGGHDGPPANVLEQEAHTSAGVCVFITARGSSAVGQGAVDENSVVGNHDLGLVQLVVATVADHLVEDGRGAIAAVIVTAALDVGVAGALYGLGLVAPAAVVVEAVWVVVRIEVRSVRPGEEGVECQCSEAGAEEKGRDAGGRGGARAIRLP